VTILAYGTMVHVAIATAEAEGIDAEVLDLRTIVPVDIEAIEASVKKTGRCVVFHEATRTAASAPSLPRSSGALLLPSRSAGAARDRLRHAVPALDGMGLFSGPVRLGLALKKALED
jgi:2-oxoisovalerate dehydrogenase E1 component beta subunit